MGRLKTAAPRWRDGKTTAERGYGARWQRLRKAFLARPENVLCRRCEAEGKTVVATVVDHITPHRGDDRLFWNEANWQPLCKQHHDGWKRSIEMGHKPRQTIGVDGWPVG